MFTNRKPNGQENVFPQSDDFWKKDCNYGNMKYSNQIRRLRTERGITQQALADGAGLSKGFISLLESGTKQLTQDTAKKLSSALNVQETELYGDHNSENAGFKNPSNVVGLFRREGLADAKEARFVPIVGSVQAGVFMQVDDIDYVDENTDFVPFYDPKYERATVRGLRVVGDSCNLIYPEGSTVLFVPTAEAGLRPEQYVIARRYDSEGKAETTIKQIMMNDGVIELWPRSTSKKHQEPIILPPRDETAQVGIEIIGVVIGSFNKAPEGSGPWINI